MSVVSVATPFNIDLEFNIATFGRRLVAWLVDTVLQVLYAAAYWYVIYDSLPSGGSVREVAMVLLCLLPLALYHFLFEVFLNGQSIGKKLLGIRVVNIMGNKASVSQYLIRLLFRSFTIMPLVLAIFADAVGNAWWLVGPVFMGLAITMFVMYLNSKLGQRFGDRLADTIVIEEKAQAEFHKTIYLDVAETNYKAWYPDVMKLTDRDINGIRNLLDQKKISRDTQAYMDRIAARICEVLGITTTQDSYAFLGQLLRDYNFLTRK